MLSHRTRISSIRLGTSFTTLLGLTFLSSIVSASDFHNEKREIDLKDETKQKLSEATGIPLARLDVRHVAASRINNSEEVYSHFKVYDPLLRKVSAVSLDSVGRAVDFMALWRENEAQAWNARKKRTEKLELYLAERLESNGQQVQIMVRLNTPENSLDRHQSFADLSQFETVALKERARVEGITKTWLEEWGLIDQGWSVLGAMAYGPIESESIELLADDERVGWIGLSEHGEIEEDATRGEEDDPPYAAALNMPVVLANLGVDQVHSAGITGAGIKAGFYESKPVELTSSCLASTTVTMEPVVSTSAEFNHFTKCAAMIVNRDDNYNRICSGNRIGFAPGVSLYLAGSAQSGLAKAQWLFNNSVSAFGRSYGSGGGSGSMIEEDLFHDYMASHFPYPTIVQASGSHVADQGDFSKGKGHNMLATTSGIPDSNIATCNDTVGNYGWKDPTSPHSDREKPDLLVPVNRTRVFDSDFGATSASAPATVGLAALVQQRMGTALFPMGVRAILQASALYEFADNKQLWWPSSPESADNLDGAGVVNAKTADLIAQTRQLLSSTSSHSRAWDVFTASPSAFDSSGWPIGGAYYSISVTAGQRVRIVFATESATTVSGSTYTSTLDSDFDIWAYASNGTTVRGSSTSWDSSYEMIDFVAPVTETIRLKVHRVGSFSAAPDAAIAWFVAPSTQCG